MTSQSDIETFQQHSAWNRLREICAVDVQAIDDLIVEGNHHVTLTLAYTRQLLAEEQACKTCFIFLVSDCVFSNGSLAYVLSRIQGGVAGVLAGHVLLESGAAETFGELYNSRTHELCLTSRELMTIGLSHLHSTTNASIVQDETVFDRGANRLYWRVDSKTIIGRFYLMHMIAIKPETDKFSISASCDYSFIPEMCPSGNIAVIGDSDDYLGVEMHPESSAVPDYYAPTGAKELARSLSAWTTAQHRDNARHTLVLHAADIPDVFESVKATADRFIAAITGQLSNNPMSHRQHPYWITALQAHRALNGGSMEYESYSQIQLETGLRAFLLRLLWRLRFLTLGQPPDVGPWHPRWADFRLPLKALQSSKDVTQLAIISSTPRRFNRWVKDLIPQIVRLESSRLRETSEYNSSQIANAFGAAFLVIDEEELPHAMILIRRARALLKPGGVLLVLAISDLRDVVKAVPVTAVPRESDLTRAQLPSPTIWYVPQTRARQMIQQTLVALASIIRRQPLLVFPLSPLVGLFLIASVFCNRAAFFRRQKMHSKGSYSSAFMMFRLPETVECGSGMRNEQVRSIY
jgi:hypothetical protein